MQIKELSRNKVHQDAFCAASDDAWFWHTSGWAAYSSAYKPELNPQNSSFLVEKNGVIVALAPLFVEEKNGVREFSFGGGGLPAPALANDLSEKKRNEVLKFIFEHIDKRAREQNIHRARMRFSALAPSFFARGMRQYNYLSRFGFIDTSCATRIIDVQKPLEQLRREMRHGHKGAVAQAEKHLTVAIYDTDSITREIFDIYVNLHHKAAGRVTRPKETFDAMLSFIQDGTAFLVFACKGDVVISCAYFFIYKGNVFYGSSATIPGGEGQNAGHLVQWRAIEYMKRIGCTYYEVGLQQFGPTLFNIPTKKEIAISAFKRGFGGFTSSFWQGEKYYDTNFFKEVMRERTHAYAENI